MRFLLIIPIAFLSFISIAQPADEDEIELIIDRHNFWRNEVGVADIQYSQELAEVAYTWAQELKKQGCAFKHSKNSYGENLFKGTHGYYTAGDAVDAWGNEKKDYNYKKNICESNKVCGHYTQIVWRNTTEVGCAKVICEGNVTWVCNYNPPGNYVGQKPY
ncbi:CAP domain-containing protein [Reichenbachiella ulvae]|uniref:CAP domain-containing protein n=1 Tax=Reichenbachiella ulvae TaxID=2980104 RepID=A0ABT3CT71_9BACT|nr:CAP domain-containing protein [Reichenbachiella ulvae]MCV9386776.1 CAP domain-containing protein [Reichenbachiella ulvae]